MSILPCEVQVHKDALGVCPQCSGGVIEKTANYSCSDCTFVIWKKIANRQISKALAKALLTKGETQVVKGFRSKAGKTFSAALTLKNGKVRFAFSND